MEKFEEFQYRKRKKFEVISQLKTSLNEKTTQRRNTERTLNFIKRKLQDKKTVLEVQRSLVPVQKTCNKSQSPKQARRLKNLSKSPSKILPFNHIRSVTPKRLHTPSSPKKSCK